jgi:4-amino-4-deoxy-L-arabinose transferase-like glycosyltransferase
MSETKPTEDAKDELAPEKERPAATHSDDAKATATAKEPEGEKASGSADDTDAEDEDADDGEPDAKTEAADAKTEAADGKSETGEPSEPDLLPRGNPLRRRGIAILLAGGVPAFLLMAKNSQSWWGVPVGLICVLVAAFGVMDLLGTFDDADEHVAARTEGASIGPAVGIVIVAFLAFCGFIAAAQAAIGPWWLGSVTVTASFLGLVAAVFNVGKLIGPWKHDELGLERPLLQRHGFWVIAVGAFLYFPAMGLQSLWDPWETHYGEVAREILARDDWISLWWAQDGWFWSKPILNFWIQSLSMASLGTHYHAGMMLSGAGGSWTAHPEWVVRTPNVLMTLVAMYLLYKGVAKVFGRRAGLLGALVLATMADGCFLAHQTMTDMPFVAAMTGAMGLLLSGLNTHEDERIQVYEVTAFGKTWRLSLWHLVFGIVLLCALPQILYLLSRNIELVLSGDGPKGFRIHWDEFRSGSAGNCGLPGNEACVMHSPASIPKSVGANPSGIGQSLIRYFGGFEPSLQAIAWSFVLGGALYLNWGERRRRRLLYIAAWLCAAIATMAKGPAGFGLPMLCAFAYVATKRRWSELLRLEILTGFLVIFAVAMPWYVAMYVRHGSPFTDRLIFHDMFNRAFSHVHDTNEGDDTGIRFYLWQLGYALFPWTGLVPLGLIWGFRRSDSAVSRLWSSVMRATVKNDDNGQGAAVGDAAVMLVMWFLFAFFLFTFMGTKFHHYIFPAVPPAAMLVGVVLDDVLGERPLVRRGLAPAYAIGLGVGAAIATYGASRAWPGSIMGGAPGPGAEGHFGTAVIIGFVGLAVTAFAAYAFRSPEGDDDDVRRVSATPDVSPYRGGVKVEGETVEEARRRSHEQLMVAGAALLGALVLVLVGRDLVIKPEGADQPGAIRLLQLFTYNYRRPWPDALDFAGILGGFTAIGALLSIGIGIRALRRHAIAAFCAFSMVFALWALDVYMVKTSPHWGQHEVIEAYYKDRAGPDEQLVAYQMNWKGENFYTGNHIPAFVSSGATFQTWLKTQKEKGAKVMYFITEHSRTGGLRGEVGAKSYKELTDKTLNNKFVLIRAEL